MWEYYVKPEFNEVEAYIKHGLPRGHWHREENPEKVWYDTNSEYDQYDDNDVKHAARFRDGLVSDAYEEFCQDLCHPSWAEEYKKHSETIFR
jgi:hypothetical protein